MAKKNQNSSVNAQGAKTEGSAKQSNKFAAFAATQSKSSFKYDDFIPIPDDAVVVTTASRNGDLAVNITSGEITMFAFLDSNILADLKHAGRARTGVTLQANKYRLGVFTSNAGNQIARLCY